VADTATTVEFRPAIYCRPSDAIPPTTAPDSGGQAVLAHPALDQICLVGPAGATGEILEVGSAEAMLDPATGHWIVTVQLRPDGVARWESMVMPCFEAEATCPSRQLAIAIGDVIVTAPTVVSPEFPSTIQISGSFTEQEARDLARTLNLASSH
jgi:preprotein translocase subunit SecD